MTLHTITLATLATAVALSASASMQAWPHTSGKAATPCALLTDAQIKAVLDTPVQPGQPNVTADKSECTWRDASGATRVYLSVKEPGIGYKSFRDSMQATGKMVPVTGLAEDAFFIASSGSSAALYALKAKHLVLITVDGVKASRADNEGAEKALVGQILPRL